MWIELDDTEVAAVIASMREGSVVDKLRARPTAETEAFVKAAIADELPEEFFEECGVIIRREFGAYVMCWKWISEKDAGVPTAYELLGAAPEIVAELKQLKGLRIDSIGPLRMTCGEYNDFDWDLDLSDHYWRLTFHDRTQAQPSWTYSEMWHDGVTVDQRIIFDCVLRGIELFDSRGASPAREEPLCWRIYLESFLYGDCDLDQLAKLFVVPTSRVRQYAEGHRTTMNLSKEGVLSSGGFGIPRLTVDQHFHTAVRAGEKPETDAFAVHDKIVLSANGNPWVP